MPLKEKLTSRFSAFGRVLPDEPMSKHTSFRTGGPADLLLFPDSIESLCGAMKLSHENSLPVTVIGGGTNVLVSDDGIRGITLVPQSPPEESPAAAEDGLVYAPAGITKEKFVEWAARSGYEGFEFMAGIPGRIGGGIVMNAGANSGCFADILGKADIVSSAGDFSGGALRPQGASYRRMDLEAGAVVCGGFFKLRRAENPAAVREKIRDYIEDRKKKHPLEYPSAGSVFKNPEGFSAWRLIDEAGMKGYETGGAMVSDLHTNFIINFDGASSSSILALVEKVRERVFSCFGIKLETEIRLIGDWRA